MEGVSSRCVLIKGLPAEATEQELKTCLGNRSLEVLKVHSHIESQSDKRWVVLFRNSEAARECIKQGSWIVHLPSGEITVTPDYCSECIVPDDWIQIEENSDDESSDESWIKLDSPESKELHDLSGSLYSYSSDVPNVTSVRGADGQTSDFDTQEKFMQLAAKDDTFENFPAESYQHAKFLQDRPLLEKIKPKEANVGKGNRTNSDPDETVHGAYFQDMGPESELLIPKSPSMIDHGTDYTPLQSGSIIIGKKYTNDLSLTDSQEVVTKDTDHDITQTKTTRAKQGTINLTSTRSPWSSLVTPSEKEEVFKQGGDNQGNNGPGHEKLHFPSICSEEEVDSDEDEEGQTDVYHSEHHHSLYFDYIVRELDTKDDHVNKQPLKENSMMEKPKATWSHEDPSVYNERPLSPLRTSVKDKAIKTEVLQPSTGISAQEMTKPESQVVIEGYSPNLTMFQPSQGVPSQDMTMTASYMKMPKPYAEVSFERLTMPQPYSDIQLPNMGMPYSVTGLSIQNMHVPPVTPWPINSAFIDGQLYSAVATGQVKVSGGTESYMVPPGYAGHYLYNPWQTMPSIPPGRYQMNHGAYTVGPYHPMHPSPPFTLQHVPTPFSQPSCPPSQASFMYSKPSLRPPLVSQPTQGGFSELEGPRDIAGQRAAASQTGLVQEDGGCVNKTGRPQSITNAESIEQTKATVRRERVTVELNPKTRKREDSDMKEDKRQSQVYPRLSEDQFQYNKDSVNCKGCPGRANLRDSQRISHDDRLGALEEFESHKEASSDAHVHHSDRGMNINKPVEWLPLEDDAERFYSVDSKIDARMKEANEDSVYSETRHDSEPLKVHPRSSAEFPLPPVPGVQMRPHSEVDVDIQVNKEQPHGKSGSALEKVENKPQKDQEDNETPRMIRVWGLTKSVSQNALEMFFENKNGCGGGEIESLEWRKSKGEAFITFKDPTVVQSVLEKQKREPFHMEQLKLTVEEYIPLPPDPLRLFLKNLSPKVTQELLLLYLKSQYNTTPSEILFGRLQGTALVTFSEPPDVKQLMWMVKEKSLEGQYFQVIRVPITCCVRLLGLSPSTTRDTVKLYFENTECSGGGPVADVRFGREKQFCIISFENAEDAKRVCTKQHMIDQKDIQVCLYYECLDADFDADEFPDLTHGMEDTVGQLKLPDPVTDDFWSLDSVKMKFIKRYKKEDIKALEKRFESSHIKLFIIGFGDQRRIIKINGTKDGCKEVKTALEEMAKNIITREYVMVNKAGLKELIHSSKGTDQLHSVELRFKCFIQMKDSGTPGSLQLEGASGGHSSGKYGAGQSYQPMDWQSSSDNGGASIDVGGIKVSVVQGELAKQKVDVIVNSTSQNLDLKRGAISEAILKNGGEIIQKECLHQYPSGINPGQIVVTSGGRLCCKNVYHGCLRAYDGRQGNSIELMKTFIFNCLLKAEESGLQSMAIPALGTGILGFPADDVAKLMVQCIETFGKKIPNTSLKDITLVVYPSDINKIKAFTTVVGGNTAPSASTQQSASSSSNISIVHGMCRCTLPHLVFLDIVQGDITKEMTDVIVNSVLSDLNLNQGQVSKAILAAGGISIQQEYQDKNTDLKKYGYVVTSPGKLLCKMIIHMAAQNNIKEWEDMIKQVLHQADQRKYLSISFPALGTGGKGLSPKEIAQAMYSACAEFAKSQPVYLKKIRVVLFQKKMLTPFVQSIKDHSSVSQLPVAGKLSKGRSRPSSLVFSITIDSESNFKEAVTDLENFVKSEITEKEINSHKEIISKLLDSQVTEMETMGQGKAMVSVNRKTGVIVVSGAPREVLETYDRTIQYLHGIERDKMKEDLEKLKAQQAMSGISVETPKHWTVMKSNENLKVVTLDVSNPEYTQVVQEFYRSTGRPVKKVERIQNVPLYAQYMVKKKQMEMQNAHKNNERILWHGTTPDAIEGINTHGFNRSYCGKNAAAFGNGVYFAASASYSVREQYSCPDGNGDRRVYLCSVLTGDYTLGKSGMKVPPSKSQAQAHILYDSVVNKYNNPDMFVIFHDAQAYPNYLITFK